MSLTDMTLRPLEKCAIQPYFSNRLQLADIIGWVLGQIGPASVMVSTFSTSEAFLRRLHRFKEDGKILSCELYCDIRATKKTRSLYTFIKSVVDRIFLCENHSKVVLFVTPGNKIVSIVTSQNQTRGDRFESGIITTDAQTWCDLQLAFHDMREKSVSLDKILEK